MYTFTDYSIAHFQKPPFAFAVMAVVTIDDSINTHASMMIMQHYIISDLTG